MIRTTVRPPQPNHTAAADQPSPPLTYERVYRAFVLLALAGTMFVSLLSSLAFVATALRPAGALSWLIAIAVGAAFEALFHVMKLSLRTSFADRGAWFALLVDWGTNTAGVYWFAPGIATVPGIAHALAALGLAGEPAVIAASAVAGLLLSAAPVWMLPLAFPEA